MDGRLIQWTVIIATLVLIIAMAFVAKGTLDMIMYYIHRSNWRFY